MQNCYVGDVGDFGKYGLLRALSGMGKSSTFGTRLCLGVVWYHYPDEPDNPDGNRTAYRKATGSKRDRFRDCAPPLYDALKRLVDEERRNIYAVQQCGILPGDTLYYGVSLSYRRGEDRAERQAKRERWLADALEAVSEADVVFVDPDNGVASEKVVPWRKTGSQVCLYGRSAPALPATQGSDHLPPPGPQRHGGAANGAAGGRASYNAV